VSFDKFVNKKQSNYFLYKLSRTVGEPTGELEGMFMSPEAHHTTAVLDSISAG